MSKPTARVQFRKAKDGWRWRVRAWNGRIVAESGEAYARKSDAEDGAILTETLMRAWIAEHL